MNISILIAALWIIFCVTGIVAYGYSERGYYSFYDLFVTDSSMESSILAHLVAAFSLLIGSYAWRSIHNIKYISPVKMLETEVDYFEGKLITSSLLVATIICFISTVLTYGLNDIFYRNYYLADTNALATLSQLSAVVAVFAASLAMCGNTSKLKLVAYFCFSTTFFMVFAKGSRFAVVALLLFQFIPLFLGPKSSKASIFFKVVITSIISYYLFHAMLYFRSESQYGLIPFFGSLYEAFESIFENNLQSLWDILLNISFSLPVTEITIQHGAHEIGGLVVSLSPLPGEVAGWYEIADARRISDEVPFSALGELYGFHPLVCSMYMVVAGVIFEFSAKEISSGNGRGRLFFLIFLFAIGLLFSLYAAQYNLRSTTRLLYYLLLIVFTWKYFFKNNSKSSFEYSKST